VHLECLLLWDVCPPHPRSTKENRLRVCKEQENKIRLAMPCNTAVCKKQKKPITLCIPSLPNHQTIYASARQR
jgi:hypothetical protein